MIRENGKMIQITDKSILNDIIKESGSLDRSYMIDPMEQIDFEIPEEIAAEVSGEAHQHVTFADLTLEQITKIIPAWNLPSMVQGFRHLVNRLGEHTVFCDIWGQDTDEEVRAHTGLAVFPLKERKKFVLICPGGGYMNVCSLAEGFPLAEAMNRLGYAAFVLQYRTNHMAKAPNPMDDLAQAVRYIHVHAEEWNIDVNDYALMGFSAGGHLAASFGTKSLGYAHYGLPKPGAIMLGYPVITMGTKTHEGSRQMLLGTENLSHTLADCYSIEKQIDKEYPPVYLWQCEADDAVPVENSRFLAQALEAVKVPYQYELFPGSAHGWGLGTGTAADGWEVRAVHFWENALR